MSDLNRKLFMYGLFLFGMVAVVFYSIHLDTADQINPLTQSQVVMQGHSSLQIEDYWYEIG